MSKTAVVVLRAIIILLFAVLMVPEVILLPWLPLGNVVGVPERIWVANLAIPAGFVVLILMQVGLACIWGLASVARRDGVVPAGAMSAVEIIGFLRGVVVAVTVIVTGGNVLMSHAQFGTFTEFLLLSMVTIAGLAGILLLSAVRALLAKSGVAMAAEAPGEAVADGAMPDS